MEDSFKVRVDKVFGSLLATNTPSSSSTSLWSLSDEELEKKDWKRGTSRQTHSYIVSPHPLIQPYSSNTEPEQAAAPSNHPLDHDFGIEFQSDLQELNDEDSIEEENPPGKMKAIRMDSEEEQVWEIRSSIGLDCTLDYEEEEDENDKVAIGRGNTSDCIYMQDMVGNEIDVDAPNELPNSLRLAVRDPRANHVAARLRLKEDADAAGDFHTLKLADILDPHVDNIENGIPPKPILKKRECSMDGKLIKRVRFHELSSEVTGSDMDSTSVEQTSFHRRGIILPHDQSLVLGEAADEASGSLKKSSSNEEAAAVRKDVAMPDIPTSVPDYLRNPTKYTRYTLDLSNNMDETSNHKACMEFLNSLKKPSAAEMRVDEAFLSSQHPLTFNPKKKPHSTSLVKEDEFKRNQYEDSKGKAFPVSVAAGDTQDGEDSAMEEAEIETVPGKISQKPCRHYRTRANVDSYEHRRTTEQPREDG